MGNYKRISREAKESIQKLDHQSIIDDLKRLASEWVGDQISCEQTVRYDYNPHYQMSGCCVTSDYAFKSVRMYYNNLFDLLVGLAHEVGHLHTMGREDIALYNVKWQHVFRYERLASRWALAYLSDKLDEKDLAHACETLNYALETYYDGYNLPQVERERLQVCEKQEVAV